jgi:hypothetical protein
MHDLNSSSLLRVFVGHTLIFMTGIAKSHGQCGIGPAYSRSAVKRLKGWEKK